jgi:hypothetical protein
VVRLGPVRLARLGQFGGFQPMVVEPTQEQPPGPPPVAAPYPERPLPPTNVNVKAAIPPGLTTIPATNLGWDSVRKGDFVYFIGRQTGYETLLEILDAGSTVTIKVVSSNAPSMASTINKVESVALSQMPDTMSKGEPSVDVTIYRKSEAAAPAAPKESPLPWILGGAAILGIIGYVVYQSK